MFEEFKKFAMRGNVLDLAIGVIIGASFTGIINSLVNDIIMPPIGLALGGVDFSNFFWVLKGETADTLAAAQRRLTAKVKNAVPPMLEGDIFSSLFEGATGWKVGTCQGDAAAARCPVALTHVSPPVAGRPPVKPANWSDTVLLTNTPQGWKVDDVIYDAGFAFGNTGRLSAMLRMVVASNP